MMVSLILGNVWNILASIFVIFISHKLLRRFLRRRKYRLPPGPKRLPILGNLGMQSHLTLFDHRDKFGDISYMNVLGRDIFVLNSVEVVRDALQGERTAEVFSSRIPTYASKHMVPDDIVMRSLNSDNWKPLRQMLHTMLKQYGEGIVALEKVVCNELDAVIGNLNTKVGQDVDLEDYIGPSIVNIIYILLIGERFDSDHWKVKIGTATNRVMLRMANAFVDMILDTFPFLRFLPFGPGALHQYMCKCRDTVLGFLYRDLKNLPEELLVSRKGIVYEMMRFRKKNAWLRESNIKGVIVNTFFAGFMTTDSTLRAFFLILLHYPDVQAKIQQEIDEVVGRERRPNLSDRANMPYTQAAILEISRYASIVPISIPHACDEDTEFRGYTVPRGTIIITNLYRIHHDERVWKHPWEFDPKRFLDEAGNLLPASHPKRRNLIPFGVGKRLCMGENFAKTRIFLYVTYLLQEFNVKPTDYILSCDSRDFPEDDVLCPAAYKVRIERRN